MVKVEVWRLKCRWSGGHESWSCEGRFAWACASKDCSSSATPGSPSDGSGWSWKLLAIGKYPCSSCRSELREREAGEGWRGCRSREFRSRGDVGGGGAVTTAATLGPGLAPRGDFPLSRYPR